MMNAVETTDLFRGAFFLCNGGSLVQVRLGEDNHKIVSFLIEGDGIDRLDVEYRNGQALVNPLQFRESLNHLRDVLFNTLRKATTTRECFVEARGETRYDRERKNRRAKKKH